MIKNIIRTEKNKDNPYVMIHKGFINDKRLGWKAKGILVYLLSKPDHWKVVIEDLINQTDEGEKGVRAGMNELKKYNYLQKYPVYEDSKVSHWETTVHETPFSQDKRIKCKKVVKGKETTVLAEKLQVGKLQVGKEGLVINDLLVSNELKVNNEKRYTILTNSDNCEFLDIYLYHNEQHMKRKHPQVKESDKEYILDCLEELRNVVSTEDFEHETIKHFDNLPKNNNGNILYFIKTSARVFEYALDAK